MNDSPVDCQSRIVTEPQWDGGFAEGKDGGVVANDFSKLYVSRVAIEFVETITYYPSVSYADISPRKGRLVIKTPLLHIILYFKLTDKPEFTTEIKKKTFLISFLIFIIII